eukprot:2478-Heterococcus_DN1.PRE.1
MASHLAGNCSKYSSGGTVVGAFWHLNGMPIPCSLPVVVHSALIGVTPDDMFLSHGLSIHFYCNAI